jgi:hypothetical protein
MSSAVSGKRKISVFSTGYGIPMFLHGIYDWLCGLEMGFAALVVGFSFVLFYVYLQKLRKFTGERKDGGTMTTSGC